MFDYFWGVLFKITLVLIFLFIYKVPSWYKVGVCTSTLGRIRGIKHDLNTVKKYSYKNWPYQNISDPIKVFNLELITIMQYCSVAGTLEAAPAPDLEMLVASPERFC